MDRSITSLFHSNRGNVADKWASYLPFYDSLLPTIEPADILEIGIQNGGFLEILAQYYPAAKNLVGCDIDPRCAQIQFSDPRIRFHLGNAASEETAKQLLRQFPDFGLIIDDGSHQSLDIIAAFINFFPSLKSGGVYIVEDLCCSYWPSHGGGLLKDASAIEFFKLLVDVIHASSWNGTEQAIAHLLQRHPAIQDSLPRLITAAMGVEEITFRQSICVLRRGDSSLGERLISGERAAVTAPSQIRSLAELMEALGLRADASSSL